MRKIKVIGKKVVVEDEQYLLHGEVRSLKKAPHDWLVHWYTDIYKFKVEIAPQKQRQHFNISKTVDTYTIRLPRKGHPDTYSAMRKAAQMLIDSGRATHDSNGVLVETLTQE